MFVCVCVRGCVGASEWKCGSVSVVFVTWAFAGVCDLHFCGHVLTTHLCVSKSLMPSHLPHHNQR